MAEPAGFPLIKQEFYYEGAEEEFMESLEKAKKTLKAFDEEHGTNFADKAVIISDVVVDY